MLPGAAGSTLVQPVQLNGLAGRGPVELSSFDQLGEHPHHDGGCIDVEVAAERAPGIGASEAVGAKEDQGAGTNGAIWSGTARIQSDTAVTGPGSAAKRLVT